MLKINKINKKFNQKEILKDISFNLDYGKCYGLFGNNGVGKTTLTKIIFNELIANSGEISFEEKPQKEINYNEWYFFVENNELPGNISVIAYIQLVANVYQIDMEQVNQYIEKFAEIIDIKEIQKTLIKKISAGQKKLVSLFIMFIVKPKVIFLDEPTANLDIKNKELILKVIKEFITPKTIVVIITHLIDEVNFLIDHVMIMDNGKIIYNHPLKKDEDIKLIFKKHTTNNIALIDNLLEDQKHVN